MHLILADTLQFCTQRSIWRPLMTTPTFPSRSPFFFIIISISSLFSLRRCCCCCCCFSLLLLLSVCLLDRFETEESQWRWNAEVRLITAARVETWCREFRSNRPIFALMEEIGRWRWGGGWNCTECCCLLDRWRDGSVSSPLFAFQTATWLPWIS